MGDHTNWAFNKIAHRDQVEALTNWFNSWNESEQAAALFALIKRLSLKQTKFLMIVLEQSLAYNSTQLSTLENLANDSEHLKSIDSKDSSVVFQLLSFIPLLRPGNNEAAMIFTEIIMQCVNACMDQSKNLEECRQLIRYALIHPALSSDQRAILSPLLLALEQPECNMNARFSTDSAAARLDILPVGNTSGSTRESALGSSEYGGGDPSRSSVGNMANSNSFEAGSYGVRAVDAPSSSVPLHSPVSATLSAPPTLMGANCLFASNLLTSQASSGNSSSTTFNMPTPPTPLSSSPDYDSSYGGSTGSLSEPYEHQSRAKDKSGMKDVPAWLKSLRLHKYSVMFSKFTYEEMLALDEKVLFGLGVTKGARQKIILSIGKLNNRAKELRQMEKDAVESGGNVKQILSDLKTMMNTPIKGYTENAVTVHARKPSLSSTQSDSLSSHSKSTSNLDESESSCNSSDDQNAPENQTLTFDSDNIPELVCNLLGILCSQIVLHPDEDNGSNYMHILDRCYCHEAFTLEQRQRISQWRTQCQRLSRSSNLRTLGGNNANNSSNRRPSFPNTGRSSPFYANNNQKFGVGTFAVGSNAPQPMGSNGPSNATVGSGRSNISSNANSRPFTPQGRSNSIGGGPYAGNPRYHQGYQQGHGSVYGANGSLAGASFANTTNKAFGSSYFGEQQSSLFSYPCTPNHMPAQGGNANHQTGGQYQSAHTANGHHRSNTGNNDHSGNPMNVSSPSNCFNNTLQHSNLHALPSVGHHLGSSASAAANGASSAVAHQMVNPVVGTTVAHLPKVPSSNHKPLLRTQSAGSPGGAPHAMLSVFSTNGPSGLHNSSNLSSVVGASASSAAAAAAAAAQFFNHRATGIANNNNASSSNYYNSFANNNNNPIACNIRNEDGVVISENGGSGAAVPGRVTAHKKLTTSTAGLTAVDYNDMGCPGNVGPAGGTSGLGGLVSGVMPTAAVHNHHHRRRLSPSLGSPAYDAASATSVDSISSLESLCRSVADHALNANSDHISPTPSSLLSE